MQLLGYRFRLVWAATSMTVIVNGKHEEDARGRAEKWLKRGALFAQFLGTCEPLPRDRREKLPRKVF